MRGTTFFRWLGFALVAGALAYACWPIPPSFLP
jgi:hypothetical protein